MPRSAPGFWQGRGLVAWCLFPLSLLFASVAGLRRRLFALGLLKAERLPVPEDHPLRPISSYGIVKVAIEQYLRMHGHLGRLDPLILRPSNPYGPRQSAAFSTRFLAIWLDPRTTYPELRQQLIGGTP